MITSARRPNALLLVLGLVALGAPARIAAETADRTRDLGHGYAQLYDAASGLRFVDELLLVKFESDETERVINELADYASRLRAELGELARAHPSLSLDDDGLPVLERTKRAAQQRYRLRTLAPLKGAAGADFERTLLLSQSGACNHLRFLAAALAEAETSAPRRDYIRGVQRELDRHYFQIVDLLDRRFFAQPAKTPVEASQAKPP